MEDEGPPLAVRVEASEHRMGRQGGLHLAGTAAWGRLDLRRSRCDDRREGRRPERVRDEGTNLGRLGGRVRAGKYRPRRR